MKILGLSRNLDPKSSGHSQPGKTQGLLAPKGNRLLRLQETRSKEAREISCVESAGLPATDAGSAGLPDSQKNQNQRQEQRHGIRS